MPLIPIEEGTFAHPSDCKKKMNDEKKHTHTKFDEQFYYG